jgi:hypothetical protein
MGINIPPVDENPSDADVHFLWPCSIRYSSTCSCRAVALFFFSIDEACLLGFDFGLGFFGIRIRLRRSQTVIGQWKHQIYRAVVAGGGLII